MSAIGQFLRDFREALRVVRNRRTIRRSLEESRANEQPFEARTTFFATAPRVAPRVKARIDRIGDLYEVEGKGVQLIGWEFFVRPELVHDFKRDDVDEKGRQLFCGYSADEFREIYARRDEFVDRFQA